MVAMQMLRTSFADIDSSWAMLWRMSDVHDGVLADFQHLMPAGVASGA
jgi:AICAR transformylase/IMP cyclohydrolase PurH